MNIFRVNQRIYYSPCTLSWICEHQNGANLSESITLGYLYLEIKVLSSKIGRCKRTKLCSIRQGKSSVNEEGKFWNWSCRPDFLHSMGYTCMLDVKTIITFGFYHWKRVLESSTIMGLKCKLYLKVRLMSLCHYVCCSSVVNACCKHGLWALVVTNAHYYPLVVQVGLQSGLQIHVFPFQTSHVSPGTQGITLHILVSQSTYLFGTITPVMLSTLVAHQALSDIV